MARSGNAALPASKASAKAQKCRCTCLKQRIRSEAAMNFRQRYDTESAVQVQV
jgi:hypothetical protein